LECQMKSVARKDTEQSGYNAISYTWGDLNQTTQITVNGYLLKVTQNCNTALRQAWGYDQEAWYWIDSVCIDQLHPGEKGHQVSLMGQTYSEAKIVLACVGDQADGSDIIFRFANDNRIALSHFWRQFRAFMRRPYFRRLWVYQEQHLGRHVTFSCGNDTVPAS
ncbi:hypothetical protein M406DRAFT_242654, partial [Cryphonectria parasitica EP155]